MRPASRHLPRAADGSLPDCWLLAEWPPEAEEPSGYWLSDLPADAPIAEPPAWPRSAGDRADTASSSTASAWTTRGPPYLGWHRHVTLAVLAQAFCTMIRTDPKAPAPG